MYKAEVFEIMAQLYLAQVSQQREGGGGNKVSPGFHMYTIYLCRPI
jgi:hypothetical protein